MKRTARACREMIWDALGGHGICPVDRATWTRPLVRIACPEGEPFTEAAASPKLAAAYDDQVQFDLRPYRALKPAEIEALDQAARRYGEYLQRKARITLP